MLYKSRIIKEFNTICLSHAIPDLNPQYFHHFINGLYQAEGTAGVYFVKENSLKIKFLFSLGQNYSTEALNVLLILQKTLCVGNVKLEFNSKGQPHLRYIVSNTKDIFNITLPYFSLLYGQKKIDLAILNKVYKLSTNKFKGSNNNSTSVSEFIHLVYSTNPEGNKRKTSLVEKLKIFNCLSLTYCNSFEVEENDNLPSKLFIVGLFLGDDSLGFVFDSPPSRLPKFYLKIVFNFAAQSNTKHNLKLLKLIAKRMDLKPHIYTRQPGMLGLEYTGEIVFNSIVPFLAEYSD